MSDIEPLGQMVEWEAHKQAKARIAKLFWSADWEVEQEADLTVSDLDGKPREYRGDVVAVRRNPYTDKIEKRVVVEVDTIKAGGGHLTRRAISKDNARTRAIAESYFNREDEKQYITRVKRVNTQDVIGKKKNRKDYFIDDDTLRLEFGITRLQDWSADHA